MYVRMYIVCMYVMANVHRLCKSQAEESLHRMKWSILRKVKVRIVKIVEIVKIVKIVKIVNSSIHVSNASWSGRWLSSLQTYHVTFNRFIYLTIERNIYYWHIYIYIFIYICVLGKEEEKKNRAQTERGK